VVAHVLAISGGTHLSTPDGAPALTVAFPDPAADPTVLQGPNFARAYRREVGVVHYSHPEAHTGRHSIVWGHALDQEELNEEALLEGPKHSSANPTYERHQPEANLPEIPQGLHGAPQLRSENEPVAENVDRERIKDASLSPDPRRVPNAPETAQDSAIDAADEKAHNAVVAAEQATLAADSATANAEEVHHE
jgi:hypothetical protein